MRGSGTAYPYGSARDAYPQSMFPPRLVPTKPMAVWYYRFASAVLFLETFTAFVAEWPDEFPAVTRALRADVTIRHE